MTYDIAQSIFMLNLASNGVAAIRATQAELQSYFSAYLFGGTSPIGTDYPGFLPTVGPKLAGGDWTIAWGPAVTLPPKYVGNAKASAEAANAAFVAYSATNKMYVVAIAATNFKSIYDWLAEDGDVGGLYQAPWQVGSATPIGQLPSIAKRR